MPTMRFVFLLAFSISFLPIFQAAAQVCPPPRQPELGQTLQDMAKRQRYLDVRKCVVRLIESDDSESYTDEVNYQLASQYRSALDRSLSGANPSAQEAQQVVRLWLRYIEFARPEFDPSRHRAAWRALVLFGAYSKLQDFTPSIIKAMDRADGKLTVDDAELLFRVIRRCPNYSNISDPNRNISCRQDCTTFFNVISKDIRESLGRATQMSGPARSAFSQNNEALLGSIAACPRG
jgi:hypothetical protein